MFNFFTKHREQVNTLRTTIALLELAADGRSLCMYNDQKTLDTLYAENAALQAELAKLKAERY